MSAAAGTADAAQANRFFIWNLKAALAYEFQKFTSETDVCNYAGSSSPMCSFAKEFYSASPDHAGPIFSTQRVKIETGRPHLFGGGAVAEQSAAAIAALLGAGTSLTLPVDGTPVTGCFDLAGANGCADMSLVTSYDGIAAALATALNNGRATVGTVAGSIVPVVEPISGSVNWGNIKVTGYGGGAVSAVPIGGFVCTANNPDPCYAASPDVLNAIEAPMSWNPGWYSAFGLPYHPTETFSGRYSYGMLTVTGVLSGSINQWSGIAGTDVPDLTYLFARVDTCTAVPPSPSCPWQYIVNNAPTYAIASETMTVTTPLLQTSWHNLVGPTITWGFFDIQPDGNANPLGATLGYATGTAAEILGLTQGAPGYPGVPYSSAWYGGPGAIVGDVGKALSRILAANPGWTSCEISFSSESGPGGLAAVVQAWGAAQTPPVKCPSSWVQTPASTPPAGY